MINILKLVGLRSQIPGLTLPWSHAPMLVVAFLVGQMVHEPGHSITGALSVLFSTGLISSFTDASTALADLVSRRC